MNEEIMVAMGLKTDSFSRGIRSVKSVAKEGAESIKDSFNEMGKSLIAVFSATALIEGMHKVLEFGEKIQSLSESTGVSTDFLQDFTYGVQQSGGKAEEAEKAIQKLSVKIGQARDFNEEAQKSFIKLGISIDNTNGTGKTTEAIMREVADKIHDTKDATEACRIAVDMFGKSGVGLVDVLKGGSKAFDEFHENAKRLSTEDLENIHRLNAEFESAGNAAKVWGGKLITVIADLSQAAGAFSTGGFTKVREFFNEKGRKEAEDYIKTLESVDLAKCKDLSDLIEKLAKAQEKATLAGEDNETQLNHLMEKAATLQQQVDQYGERTEKGLHAKIALAETEMEIANKYKVVQAERQKATEREIEQALRRLQLQAQLTDAARGFEQANMDLEEARKRPAQYTIEELANARNFGGKLGEDQRIARKIKEWEGRLAWDKANGNIETMLKIDLPKLTALKNSLSNNVPENERNPYAQLEKNMVGAVTNLQQALLNNTLKVIGYYGK